MTFFLNKHPRYINSCVTQRLFHVCHENDKDCKHPFQHLDQHSTSTAQTASIFLPVAGSNFNWQFLSSKQGVRPLPPATAVHHSFPWRLSGSFAHHSCSDSLNELPLGCHSHGLFFRKRTVVSEASYNEVQVVLEPRTVMSLLLDWFNVMLVFWLCGT